MKILNAIKYTLITLTLCITTAHAADKAAGVEVMEGSRIIGSEELPKIFYVIGWQEKNIRSNLFLPEDYLKIDTLLLDRDIVRRNIRLHQASTAAAKNKPSVTP